MAIFQVTDSVVYIGVDDKTIDLFEGQYVVPNGISYNSYLLLDESTVLLDTVDKRGTEEWSEQLRTALGGRDLDYLVISHMEPDHAASIAYVVEHYPQVKLIGNAKTFPMLSQFFDIPDLDARKVVVTDGQTLSFGRHTLQFVMAPMVHWPEVMVEYDATDRILFSADGFGKFGALDTEEDWACEARRYYFNIVGKYGAPVQTLLKKAAGLDIAIICPLHGPVLTENLGYYIGKYDVWSSYTPEDEGVLVAYASIHGHTAKAAKALAQILEEKGAKKVVVTDLARDDMAEAVEDAFRYSHMVVASATYDGGLFPFMEEFLLHLKSKAYQKRKVGIMENGSWAPTAAKGMRELLSGMKNVTVCDTVVTIRSAMKESDRAQMEAMAAELLG